MYEPSDGTQNSRLKGSGESIKLQIKNDYFDALRRMMPVIDVKGWYEAVSANQCLVEI